LSRPSCKTLPQGRSNEQQANKIYENRTKRRKVLYEVQGTKIIARYPVFKRSVYRIFRTVLTLSTITVFPNIPREQKRFGHHLSLMSYTTLMHILRTQDTPPLQSCFSRGPGKEEADKFWSIFPPKHEEETVIAFSAAS
jgi:hypothetical protein